MSSLAFILIFIYVVIKLADDLGRLLNVRENQRLVELHIDHPLNLNIATPERSNQHQARQQLSQRTLDVIIHLLEETQRTQEPNQEETSTKGFHR